MRRRVMVRAISAVAAGAVAVGTAAVVAATSSSASVKTAGATPALPSGGSLSPTADTSWWGTNGRVMDIVTDGSSAWIGGGFDYVGPTTGHGVVVDATTAVRTSADNLQVDGPVEASVADGSGGYYLAGSFLRVGSARRAGVVHIGSDGKIDRTFSPDVTGDVHALTLAGGRIIIGGQFSLVNGTAVTDLAALRPDGTLDTSWSAATNGAVFALRTVGSYIYVGGWYSSIRGVGRGNLARVNVSDGSVDGSFTTHTSAAVRALDVRPGATTSSDLLIVGGDFTSVTSAFFPTSVTYVTAIRGDGSLSGWAPSVNGHVTAVSMSPDGSTFLVGGPFTTFAGQARVGVARVSSNDGSLQPFDAGLAGCHLPNVTKDRDQFTPCTTTVTALSWTADGSSFYVGGLFTTTQGNLRHDVASYDATSGAVSAWSPLPGNQVFTVTPFSGGVIVGGDFTSTGGLYRVGLAKIDLSTGQADPGFSADTDDMVQDIELDATRTSLFAGGDFRTVGGVTRNKIVKVDAATGSVDKTFRVGANKNVESIAVRGDALYYGGLFTKVGTVSRLRAAKVSATTGAADPAWVANATGPGGKFRNGIVYAVAVAPDASRVFLAGGFTAVNGLPTSGGIIAVDGATGAVNPSRLGGVRSGCANNFIKRLYLSDDGQRLYGGDLCPDYVYQWDAVNLAAFHPNGLFWVTFCNAGMQGALEVNGRFYMGSHGGDKGRGGWCWVSPNDQTNYTQQRAMAFDATSGALLDWAPLFDSPMGVWSYAAVPQGLLVGGDFSVAGDRTVQQQGLALFRGTP